MYIQAGTYMERRVEHIWLDGEVVEGVTEANEEDDWIVRFATKEKVERLVTRPGLVWPRDKDVLIRVSGKVRIELGGIGNT